MPQGQLDITVAGAHHLTSRDWFGKQDPYVVVQYNGVRLRTKTDKDGGRNPRFNEKLTFQVVEGLGELMMSVYDRDIGSADDLIGSASVPLHQVFSSGYSDAPIQLYDRKGKTAGTVNLVLHFSPRAGYSAYNQPQYGHQTGYAAGQYSTSPYVGPPPPYSATQPPAPAYSAQHPQYPSTHAQHQYPPPQAAQQYPPPQAPQPYPPPYTPQGYGQEGAYPAPQSPYPTYGQQAAPQQYGAFPGRGLPADQ